MTARLNADDRAFQEAALAHRHVLDLVGENLEAGDADHVFLAVDDAHAAKLVHDPDIACAEESVPGHHLRSLIRPLPIAGHYLRPACADFALLAGRQFAALVIANR